MLEYKSRLDGKCPKLMGLSISKADMTHIDDDL